MSRSTIDMARPVLGQRGRVTIRKAALSTISRAPRAGPLAGGGAASIEPEAVFAVPVLDRLLRILVEAEIARGDLGLDPVRLEAQHDVGFRGWLGKLAVDGRSEGMDELRPSWVEEPERR